MHSRGSSLWLVMVATVTACEAPPADPPGLEVQRNAIVGGTAAPDDFEVFRIVSDVSRCTATLIAPRTLLTADHCLAEGPILFAGNAPSSTDTWQVVEQKRWSQLGTGSADLALLYLDRAPPFTPKPLDPWGRRLELGSAVRVLGYGLDDKGVSGERRQATTTVTSYATFAEAGQVMMTAGGAGKGLCFGDSGGPVFARLPNSKLEYVVGVHSSISGGGCGHGDGASVVVSEHRDVLGEWLASHEPPQCARDGRCVEGCADADPDCVCVADGWCSLECLDLVDPDCPRDCQANGVCSAQRCPMLDPDCAADYAPCTRDSQCDGHRCINDPQHLNRYCSHACALGCGEGAECDQTRNLCVKKQLPVVRLGEGCEEGKTWCADGTICDGVCRVPCSSSEFCGTNEVCRVTAPRVCVPKEMMRVPTAEPLPVPEQPKACSVAPHGLVLALSALWLRRRRRTHASA